MTSSEFDSQKKGKPAYLRNALDIQKGQLLLKNKKESMQLISKDETSEYQISVSQIVVEETTLDTQ